MTEQLNEIFSNIIYTYLFDAKGKMAEPWLSMIDKKGARETLRKMLVHLPLNGRKSTKKKPWKLFSDRYQIGDYVLWWDEDERFVAVIEITNMDNPYDSNRYSG